MRKLSLSRYIILLWVLGAMACSDAVSPIATNGSSNTQSDGGTSSNPSTDAGTQ